MPRLTLSGCTPQPFGAYLKALGVLRLVSEQADAAARGAWRDGVFELDSQLSAGELTEFFLHTYKPTPILAPWNGGSGFYPKDRKVGIDAIAACDDPRFADYRTGIAFVRALEDVQRGKDKSDEDGRRFRILLACRNALSDRAVEWLDASVGIAADGSRSFAPVLGTGGNEGRLDYTNNFMERITGLLLDPQGDEAAELLANALFAAPANSLQSGAAGQYDPGRAGGANQGQGIEAGCSTNPWDFVLTLEGAVAWASGLYRRQGISYRSFLCSPFTVYPSRVGYGSASAKDEARAEIWAPVWTEPALYTELKLLLREGRASVDGAPAQNGVQFAEAATALGVDRGIAEFVRYHLLKRRGDSYVALPAGEFTAGYRSESDRIRELEPLLSRLDGMGLPEACAGLRRSIDSAIFEVLLRGGSDRMRAVVAAFGRLIRHLVTAGRPVTVPVHLRASTWVPACDFTQTEVRLAAALASIYDRKVGTIRENLIAGSNDFAWYGRDLPERMVNVLKRRLYRATAEESDQNPLGGACVLDPGDATLFVEGSVDDGILEDLLFAFAYFDWKQWTPPPRQRNPVEVLPPYAVLKHLFLPKPVLVNGEPKRLRSDARILSWLEANRVDQATELALAQLKIAGLNPIQACYAGGAYPMRLAAALLIPARYGKKLFAPVLHQEN